MRHLDYNTGMGWRRDDYDKLHRVPLRRQVTKSNFHMYFFNDFHRGANGSSTSSIKEAVLTCRRKRHSYAVLLGDLAEAISINDRRFSLASHATMIAVKPYPGEIVPWKRCTTPEISDTPASPANPPESIITSTMLRATGMPA